MAQKRRARRSSPPRSRRLLALVLGLSLFAGALYVLVGGRGDEPLGEISPASRAQLERVLEREDRGPSR